MNAIHQKIHSAISHPLARGSAIVFIGSMMSNVAAYLYHVLVGRILGPESYGELASLFSLSYLLNVPALVVQTVIAKYVATYVATKNEGAAKYLVYRATKILALSSVGIGIIFIPFYKNISHFLHLSNAWYVPLVVIASIIFFLTTILTGALQGYKKFVQVQVYGNIIMIMRLIGGIVGAGYGVAAATLANTIATIIGYILLFIPLQFLKKIQAVKSGVSMQSVGSYATPSLLSILGITSLYSTDVILVKHFFSSYEAGMYAALAMMGKVIFFAGSSVAYVLLPAVSERQATGKRSHTLVYIALLTVAVISLVITAGYFAVPTVALSLLFGSSYIAASQYLGMFGVFITFFSLCNIMTTAHLGTGKTGVWWFLIASAIVQIAGITIFHASIMQVIYVNIVACFTLLIALLLYYRHEPTKS